jgi:hypothetical protein
MTQWMDSDMEHQKKAPQGSIKGILSLNRQDIEKLGTGDATVCKDLLCGTSMTGKGS